MAQPKVKASFKEGKIRVSPPEDVEGMASRGYGVSEDNGLTLTFHEALYLLGNGDLEIEDEEKGEKMVFQNLLNLSRTIDEDAWVRYLIYRDLRKRGYVVREGFGLGIDFRVYERGEYGKETATYLIFGIQEGKPVSMEELTRTLNYVQSLKKKLVLAVLNRRGEVVYYSLSQFSP